MIKKIFLSFAAITAATTGIAHANWEERPVYIDDGMRMTITVRGGAAYGFGNAKNQLGTLMPTTQFYSDGTFLYPDDPTCGGAGTATCQPLGQIDIAKIPTAKNFSGFSWDSNVAIGFTVPHAPQIRLEANWEHIGRTHYNATPLFNGDVKTTGGATIANFPVGSVYSTVTSDIITAMAYYDFFTGCVKPMHTFIPYVGVGIGYASSHVNMELSDPYGYLYTDAAMESFAPNGGDYFTSGNTSGNFAAAAAIGFSYGLMENLFIDAAIRVTYIPSIPWTLNNNLDVPASGLKHRPIFSVDNVIYPTASIGFRFEF